MKVRNLAINLALGLLSLCVALGMAGIATRIVAPQQLIVDRPDIYIPSDQYGARHRPNVETTINTGERTVRFVTDADGFRVGDGPAEDADRSVLLLGDSFMEALAVDYDNTLGARLERRLSGGAYGKGRGSEFRSGRAESCS